MSAQSTKERTPPKGSLGISKIGVNYRSIGLWVWVLRKKTQFLLVTVNCREILGTL